MPLRCISRRIDCILIIRAMQLMFPAWMNYLSRFVVLLTAQLIQTSSHSPAWLVIMRVHLVDRSMSYFRSWSILDTQSRTERQSGTEHHCPPGGHIEQRVRQVVHPCRGLKRSLLLDARSRPKRGCTEWRREGCHRPSSSVRHSDAARPAGAWRIKTRPVNCQLHGWDGRLIRSNRGKKHLHARYDLSKTLSKRMER